MSSPSTTLAILGASGRTGQMLVQQALDSGDFAVRALVRDPSKLPIKHDNLTIITGSATDTDAVNRLLTGADVVISALGPVPGHTNVCSLATAKVLAESPTRYIIVAGAAVDAPDDKKSVPNKLVSKLVRTLQGKVVADKQAELGLLQASSNVDWVFVRPPRLVDGPAKPVKSNLYDCPGMSITRASLAAFCLQEVKNNSFAKQAPFVAN